jgi:hypothetical protein
MQQKSNKISLITSLTLFLGIFFQLLAQASPSCLGQVSNSDLVDELQRRLNTSTPVETTNIALTATCSSASLNLRLINLATGGLKDSFSTYVGSVDACSRLQDSLVSVTDRGFSRAFIITTCESGSIIKTSVSDGGKFNRISSDYTGDNETCLARAIEANRRLNLR